MLSFMNTGSKRNHKIWEAARDGDVNTISRLLPQATVEDLQYEAEVIIIQYIPVHLYFSIFYCVYVLYINIGIDYRVM